MARARLIIPGDQDNVHLDVDGKVTRYPLFDSALQDYVWSYSNNGLRLAQLRFYAVPTTVPAQ